ncbi:MAG TPA: hypothetical protein VEL49_07070 [Ktedonobacteraceae bacterium]|nr:hypothetical protein [Ktedonobacteraceae bacterium]
MQPLALKPVQTYPQLQAKFSPSTDVVITPQANVPINWSITTGVDVQPTDTYPTQVQALTFIAEHLAIGLAQTFSVLEIYDRAAVYRIMSILDPFKEEIPELNFSFPPISSKEVTFDVTRKGKVEPTIYLDDTL